MPILSIYLFCIYFCVLLSTLVNDKIFKIEKDRSKKKMQLFISTYSTLKKQNRIAQSQFKSDKKIVYFLNLCVSSLRRDHANLLCIVPILTDDHPKVINSIPSIWYIRVGIKEIIFIMGFSISLFRKKSHFK